VGIQTKQARENYRRTDGIERLISIHLTTRWSGSGIQRHKQEVTELRMRGVGFERATPGRSLVPAA